MVKFMFCFNMCSVCMCAYWCVHMHVYVYWGVCMCVLVCVYVPTCILGYVYVCMYTCVSIETGEGSMMFLS